MFNTVIHVWHFHGQSCNLLLTAVLLVKPLQQPLLKAAVHEHFWKMKELYSFLKKGARVGVYLFPVPWQGWPAGFPRSVYYMGSPALPSGWKHSSADLSVGGCPWERREACTGRTLIGHDWICGGSDTMRVFIFYSLLQHGFGATVWRCCVCHMNMTGILISVIRTVTRQGGHARHLVGLGWKRTHAHTRACYSVTHIVKHFGLKE